MVFIKEEHGLLRYLLAILMVMLALSGCGETLTDAEYLTRARDYQDKGELNSSVIELKNALVASPENIETRMLLGMIYVDLGLGAAAEKELRKAIQLGLEPTAVAIPLTEALWLQGKRQDMLDLEVNMARLGDAERAKLMALQGHALLGLGQPEQALKAYEAAQAIKADEAEASLGLAYLAVRNSDSGAAREWTDKALAVEPDNAFAWSLSGRLAREKGDLQRAEADYGQAIAHREWNADDRLNRALVRVATENYQEAARDIADVRRLVNTSAGADYIEGLMLFQQGKYPDAQAAFERALNIDPKHQSATFHLGVTHFVQGHSAQAQSYLSHYAAKVPNSIRAQQLLAVLEMRNKDYDSARPRLAAVLQGQPDDVLTLKLLANLAMAEGNAAEAVEYMRKVTEQEPESGDARLRLGLGLMLKGESESGAVELQRAVELESEFRVAEFVLIMDHLNHGRMEEALAAAQEFTVKQPESPMAWNLLGLVQVKNKQPEAARKSFEHVLEIMPGEAGAANNLAVLALERGAEDEAIQLYQSVLKKRPGHMPTVEKLNTLMLRQGRVVEARNLLEKTIEAYPQALEPRVLLGDLYLKQGEADKAVTLLLEVQDKLSGNPLYHANLGRVQLAAGDLGNAVYNLERLVELLPRSPLAYQLLYQAYDKQGDRDKYEQALDRALVLGPAHFPSQVEKLKLLISQNRIEEAAKRLQALQQDNPNHPDVLVQQARLALAQGKPEEAVLAYQTVLKSITNADLVGQLALAQWQAGQREASFRTMQDWLQLHPEDVKVRYNLANLYLAAGRHDEAREAFTMVVEAYPTHAVALTNLALLTRETDPEKALGYARFAHAVAPDAPVVQDTLAQILLDQGETGQAVQLLEQAVEKAPNDLKIRYHWAVALSKNGEKESAIKELRHILGTDRRFGNEQDARELLQALTGGQEGGAL